VLLLLILIGPVPGCIPALALMVAALGLGVVSGMPLQQVPLSFTAGVGNLMGHIAIISGVGVRAGASPGQLRRRRNGAGQAFSGRLRTPRPAWRCWCWASWWACRCSLVGLCLC